MKSSEHLCTKHLTSQWINLEKYVIPFMNREQNFARLTQMS